MGFRLVPSSPYYITLITYLFVLSGRTLPQDRHGRQLPPTHTDVHWCYGSVQRHDTRERLRNMVALPAPLRPLAPTRSVAP
jgi:hypothetical protein